jgi:hypothetical protein
MWQGWGKGRRAVAAAGCAAMGSIVCLCTNNAAGLLTHRTRDCLLAQYLGNRCRHGSLCTPWPVVQAHRNRLTACFLNVALCAVNQEAWASAQQLEQQMLDAVSNLAPMLEHVRARSAAARAASRHLRDAAVAKLNRKVVALHTRSQQQCCSSCVICAGWTSTVSLIDRFGLWVEVVSLGTMVIAAVRLTGGLVRATWQPRIRVLCVLAATAV